MNLTSIIRQLEKQLKASEKYASRYEKQAGALRDKLAAVAEIAGKRFAGLISPVKTKEKKKRKLSARGLANIREGQKKRWAKRGGKENKSRDSARKGRKLSAIHKAKIAAGQKKRWAKKKGQE